MPERRERSGTSKSGIELPLELNGKLWVTEDEGRGRIELMFGSMGIVALLTPENLRVFRKDLEIVLQEVERKERYRGGDVQE